MQVIILAAGRGQRLSPITDTVPKPLVEVNGTPLIINALDIFSKHPVERFIIVEGYESKQLRAQLGDNYNGIEIIYVSNDDWDKTNNIHSLWLTRDLWDRDSVLMECDIFFDAGLVDLLLTAPFENSVLVDRFQPYMDGTIVELSADKKNITRLIPGKDQDANFNITDKYKTVNIYTFTHEFLQNIFKPTIDLYVKINGQNEYYELVLGVIVFMGSKDLVAKECHPHRWFEIDDFTDLQRAEAYLSDDYSLLQKIRKKFGGYWRYDFTDFEYLYNPYFPNQNLYNELRLNLTDLLGNYPSGQMEINHSLANWVRIDESMLAVANGGSELIENLRRSFKKVTLLLPSFDEYARNLAPEQIHYIKPNSQTLAHTPESIVKATKASGSNALVIINPSNPAGTKFTPSELHYIFGELRSLDMIILDESFADFISTGRDVSFLDELKKYPNMVILRSLSKDLGVPGIRLGYVATADTKRIAEMRSALPIWHINSLAQYFIDILPKYRNDYAAARSMVIAARDEMYELLCDIPSIKIIPSFANYFCCELPDGVSSDEIQERLFMDYKFLVKDLGKKQGLPKNKFIRIAVKRPEENKMIVNALAETLAGVTTHINSQNLELLQNIQNYV
ncbi:aminotransferase class I/II-fold pyridoxal phosphate-dependent enzyme [Desulfovibrio sp. UCD-KL4C]|uniref:aminotransferase class I/II-fold pyridoxal phosphate-dependent enzyme n=1 Tax=Desulfovibrio sp. UCD-KL4C TaxID=2578120 RepID=UPI0025B93D86|nr:aminotransferase class I/II-fold pyridoxal phosphate-dependent enzyme [Desulfovibrio sp. UCD-KL4C]